MLDPDATVPIEPMLRRLVEELRQERTEVLDPLLHRLVDLGSLLQRGREIPPAVLDEGLRLLQEYARHLHDVHIRQFAQAGLSDAHPEVCSLPMALIEQEPERAERRLASVRAVLDGYRARFPGYQGLLGVDLRNEATAELSWEGFSEDYVRTCLPTHLTPKALRAWEGALEEAREAFGQLRTDVGAFLRSTEPLIDPSVDRQEGGAPVVPAPLDRGWVPT